MNIIKPLHLGVLHKTFSFRGRDIFAVGVPVPFSLLDGEILLEQKMWGVIAGQLEDGLFDVGMPKHQGELLVAGQFFAPDAKAVEAGEVRVRIGDIHKQLRVYPPRRWRKLLGVGVAISSGAPVTEVPISYRLAFGGEGFAANPSGVGFKAVADETGEVHLLPQIEYLQQPVTAPGKEYAPASLGRIDPMWKTRLSRAGTYDAQYLRERMPGLPDDIDWRYFNEAAEDQWVDGYFRGDETFSIEHMHPQFPQLSGRLPPIYGRAFINQHAADCVNFREIPLHLDTVWFFPSEAMGVMIYRGSVEAFSNDGADIRALLLACENRNDSPRPLTHYQQQMALRLDPDHGFKYSLYTAPLIAEGMTCGFQQLKDDSDFPLDMESRKNLDLLVAEKVASAERQQAEALKALEIRLKAAGIDPAPHLAQVKSSPQDPLKAKMDALLEKMAPGLSSDPKNLDLTRLDLKVMDEIRVLGDEVQRDRIKQAKLAIQEQVDVLKARPDASLYAKAIAELERKLVEIDLPPVWPRTDLGKQIADIRQQMDKAQTQIDELRKMGVSEERLPKLQIDLEGVEEKLCVAEAKLKDSYRTGAHTLGQCRSPHPGQEAALLQQLLDAIQTGTPLAGRDFACIDLAGMVLKDLDLSGCYLEGVNFRGCRLERVNLSRAIMAGSCLRDAVLVDCNAEGANLGACDLGNAQMVRVCLSAAVLGRSLLAGSRFEQCEMAGITFLETRFEQPQFLECRMVGCNLIEAVLDGSSFEGSDLQESNLVKPALRGCNFNRARLGGVNFVEAQLAGSSFRRALMINSRFVGGCDLDDCDFSEADLSKSCLRDNRMHRTRFNGANLSEADFGGSLLNNADFERAHACRAQFIKADLGGARLVNLNLMEGSLYKAALVGADFSGSNLYSVNFMESTLGNNRYVGANLDQTILRDWRPS